MGFSIELFLYGLLLVLFMVFFGIPSIQKYQSKETIFISTREFTNGIEAPAITVLALKNDTSYGWKSKSNQTASLMARHTYTFVLDHCKEINQTDLETCISGDTFGLTDFLTTATFGISESSMNVLNRSSWTEDMDSTANGRYYTWKPQSVITPSLTDTMFLSAYKNFKFYIFVHDINYFLFCSNPLGTTADVWEFDGNSMKDHYQEIILVKHKKLNLEHRPCEESEDYSFTTCVKESIAESVGCRMPWDRLSRQDRAICTEREQFRQTDENATAFMINEINEVERLTGCLKPCSYGEYKFVNTNPKTLPVSAVPDNQLAIVLWAVTKYTQFEEEVPSVNHQLNKTPHHFMFYQVLLYPFTSLLAEFGGSLGLFLGFSFVTISDGMKSLAKWLKKNINLF